MDETSAFEGLLLSRLSYLIRLTTFDRGTEA